jgi:asparagine synthetase B (glutamine-hydrolysing)
MPLLRRPWHTLTTAADRAARTAVGFAGERGGVTQDPITGVIAAVDGELVSNRVVSGSVAAEKLLAAFLRDGPAFDPPEGWFAAAFWDPRSQALSLVTDLIGHRPIYIARHRGGLLFSAELKALVAAGLEPRLDLEAWAEMLAYEHPQGDHTPLADVRLIPPANTLTYGLDGSERLHERWRYRLEPDPHGDEGEFVEALAAALDRSTSTRRAPHSALALSGGLDSRCIAASLFLRSDRLLAATFGANGSQDLQLGTLVAARAGLPHRPLPLEDGYIARGAAATVWLAEGHVRCLHAHHLVLGSLRKSDRVDSLLIGFAGDAVLRDYAWRDDVPDDRLAAALHEERARCISDELLEAIFLPGFGRSIRGLARESLTRVLAEEDGEQRERVRQFVWRQNQRRKVLPGSELFLDDLAARDPYADADVIELARRMPEPLRCGGRLQCTLLQRVPELGDPISPKLGFSPRLAGRRRELATHRVKVTRKTRGLLDSIVGVSLWPDRRGLGDYAADLRSGSAELLSIILEPRTLSRGQIREDAVRRLVDQTLSGRARNTRALGMLLTFELFQRQFLDGDGFAGRPA